jgi:hypothetical protein
MISSKKSSNFEQQNFTKLQSDTTNKNKETKWRCYESKPETTGDNLFSAVNKFQEKNPTATIHESVKYLLNEYKGKRQLPLNTRIVRKDNEITAHKVGDKFNIIVLLGTTQDGICIWEEEEYMTFANDLPILSNKPEDEKLANIFNASIVDTKELDSIMDKYKGVLSLPLLPKIVHAFILMNNTKALAISQYVLSLYDNNKSNNNWKPEPDLKFKIYLNHRGTPMLSLE